MVRIRWVTMKLKYVGACLVCLRPIDAGKEAQWAPSIGVRHISCGKKLDQVEELKKKSFEALIHDNVDAAKQFAQDALDIEPSEKEIFSMAQSFWDDWDFLGAIALYDKILKPSEVLDQTAAAHVVLQVLYSTTTRELILNNKNLNKNTILRILFCHEFFYPLSI